MTGLSSTFCDPWYITKCWLDDSVTFIVLVNSHQRWKQTRNRVCFHLCVSWLWHCGVTASFGVIFQEWNVTEWQVSWNSWAELSCGVVNLCGPAFIIVATTDCSGVQRAERGEYFDWVLSSSGCLAVGSQVQGPARVVRGERTPPWLTPLLRDSHGPSHSS